MFNLTDTSFSKNLTNFQVDANGLLNDIHRFIAPVQDNQAYQDRLEAKPAVQQKINEIQTVLQNLASGFENFEVKNPNDSNG